MKKINILLILLVLVTAVSYGQKKKKGQQERVSQEKKDEITNQKNIQKDEFDDAFREEDDNKMTLRFVDAKTGEGVPRASVMVQDIGEFTTDLEGKITFPKIENDQVVLCEFKCQGYITAIFKTEAIAGSIFHNRFTVSELLKLGAIRVVVDWDNKPGDLDAHFVKQGSYHISFRNMKQSNDGVTVLDRDDMDGFGPETVTAISVSGDSEYEYYVHDYTNQYSGNSKALSNSKAQVKVYGGDKLLNTFNVPSDSKGVKWTVFKIVNGQIVPVNTLQ